MDALAWRVAALAALVAAAVAVGLWRRRVDGRARAVAQGTPVTAGDIDQNLGTRATLLQFSAPVCAPCTAARRVLTEVVQAVPGVAHVELDVGEHLELTRRYDVLRTPTVLVLDARGRVVGRASGVPTRAQVLEALTFAGGGAVA
jgi:thiol-disulfide isomerase/thioredoxin